MEILVINKNMINLQLALIIVEYYNNIKIEN